VLIVLMGVSFNGINAWLNGEVLFHRTPIHGSDWLTDPRFVVGLALFGLGMALHLHADHRLLTLKAQGKGYQVPTGGMFRWVSCPNYLGEIIQWTGWAVATWSLQGLAFALWTVANLAPRARTHHAWYRERFEDYPPQRRALVPRFLVRPPSG
ncbi:MAG: 3-oxo-5-alpha-steroid 4-dehydrogenase, partial [Myxococcota bacterium]|nr:3-oxo-5-alpha-steroid 4-dehydrogenase [Myxococcota bacterium]